MSLSVLRTGWLAAAALSCGGHPPPAAAPVVTRTAADLRGLWVEYWSPAGVADTQRYVFLEDGRFTWTAPANAPPQRAVRKAGRYALQSGDTHAVLTLQVSAEEFSACAAPCAHAAEGPKRVDHAAPLIETLELGECAPNQEAAAVDASYACLSFGGRAFWRRPPPAADDARFLWTTP